jgi:hypothetical protein
VEKWTQPTYAKEVHGFLGLAGYYQKFVHNFGITSRLLTDLLKEQAVFHWTPLENDAFLALKQSLIIALVLALPDFTKVFDIEIDASNKGIGAALLQEKHPLSFLSKALEPCTSMLSMYEKEALAIIMAVDHWCA